MVSEASARNGTSFAVLLQLVQDAHTSEVEGLRQQLQRALQGAPTAPPATLLTVPEARACSASFDQEPHNGCITSAETRSSKGSKEGQSLAESQGTKSSSGSQCGQRTDTEMEGSVVDAKTRGSTTSRRSSVNSAGGLKHIRAKREEEGDTPLTFIGILTRIISSKWFECATCLLILVNALVMALEVQYFGLDVGFRVDYPDIHDSAASTWPFALQLFEVSGFFFGLVFTVELVMKLFGLRKAFFFEIWNAIDTFAVLTWIVTQVGGSLPFNSSLVRLGRLARLTRLLRLVRTIQSFDALFIMTTAMKGSFDVLFWSMILMAMVQLTLALLLNQCLIEYYFNYCDEKDTECHVMFEYFGTFTRTFFTTFEMTLGNWPVPVRILCNRVTSWFLFLGVLYKVSVGFAFVGIINGVFMQETFKAALLDDIVMIRQKARAKRAHEDKMHRLFEEADSHEYDGKVTWDEFSHIISDPQVALWLQSMELDVSDGRSLFNLIDRDNSGTIEIDELIAGVANAKGTARALDMKLLLRMHDDLRGMVSFLAGWVSRLPPHGSEASATSDDFPPCESWERPSMQQSFALFPHIPPIPALLPSHKLHPSNVTLRKT
eukprot:TRINITY_DN5855_c1_g4_i2.p1 TRINITY_DN5855_c1_g4~~TRINITY_DN5855_c1_g4_i2.p1  ORF type:complete len:605 (-),score=67.99 TRINITY_DN5855_c1_g4_i2:39-1853(-)